MRNDDFVELTSDDIPYHLREDSPPVAQCDRRDRPGRSNATAGRPALRWLVRQPDVRRELSRPPYRGWGRHCFTGEFLAKKRKEVSTTLSTAHPATNENVVADSIGYFCDHDGPEGPCDAQHRVELTYPLQRGSQLPAGWSLRKSDPNNVSGNWLTYCPNHGAATGPPTH